MNRVLLFFAVLFIIPGAAAQSTALDVGPGIITPDSPLYSIETAWDNAVVTIGLKKAEDVLQERAAEAKLMQERGDTVAADRAVRQINTVAQQAQARDEQGLQKAMILLQDLDVNAPSEQSRTGIRTALQSMEHAQDRIQTGRQQMEETGDREDTDDRSGETNPGIDDLADIPR